MNAAAQYELPHLLTLAGGQIRGRNRSDCPWCKGQRTISLTDEVYFCHRCGAKGNALTLARELGLARRLTAAEYCQLRQERERADRRARDLYYRVQARRFELLDELHGFNRLQLKVHEAGPDHRATWSALAFIYREQPQIEAELDFLENATARELLRFL